MTAKEKEIDAQLKKLFAALNATDTLFPVKTKGNRYEVYTYLRLARLLSRFADAATFRPRNQMAGTFRFRAAPGKASNEFSFYEFDYLTHPFELRNGTEFRGHGMCHEVDISVSTPLGPGLAGPHKALRLAIGCKYHNSTKGLKGLLRSQVGAVLDLNKHDHHYSGCLQCGQLFRAFFASQHPPSNATGCLDYMRSYHLGQLFDFQPASRDRAIMYRLVRQLLPRLLP